MTFFLTTNSWNIWKLILTLENIKMDSYKFKSIKDHRGPYTSTDQEHLGSSYNLPIEWETGEMTWEPLNNIISDDPYSCAAYAKEFDLLNTHKDGSN